MFTEKYKNKKLKVRIMHRPNVYNKYTYVVSMLFFFSI